MDTEKINLNLTRKWRSKSFSQIVGQELSVRMLKNSLYLNQFFPVYLFSGQRGCGKTSTARVFASAVNCIELSKFQKNPKNCDLPCLQCNSCRSMTSGNHPDFIEIDAASHTGVDNVRQIIESSSFMPLMGNKKVYLIDEAHMLSKAAFNAFLKILEEPPPSVIFVLATTNPQKIIETVRSRCFQLFFKPIDNLKLIGHLKNICKKECISYDDQGLGLIVSESQGSARDSLNILEQVRFSSGAVTKNTVQDVLGHLDDERLLGLFELLLFSPVHDLLGFLRELKHELYSPQYLWKKIIELIRIAVWVKHGVCPDCCPQYLDKISKLVKKTSWGHLSYMMQLFYENEGVFTKTTEKRLLLEMILIQIAKKNNLSDKSGASSVPQKVIISACDEEEEFMIVEEEEEVEYEDDTKSSEKKSGSNNNWDSFVDSLQKLKDPLIVSIFKQGEFVRFDSSCGDLEVRFSKKFAFFNDSLKETENFWLPILQDIFSKDVKFKPSFTGIDVDTIKKSVKNNNYPVNYSDFKKSNKSNSYKKKSSFNNASNTSNKGKLVDISDVVTWKKANTLLKYFSGDVIEVLESK